MFDVFIVNQQASVNRNKAAVEKCFQFFSYCELQMSECSRENLIKSPVLSVCGQKVVKRHYLKGHSFLKNSSFRN